MAVDHRLVRVGLVVVVGGRSARVGPAEDPGGCTVLGPDPRVVGMVGRERAGITYN